MEFTKLKKNKNEKMQEIIKTVKNNVQRKKTKGKEWKRMHIEREKK